MHGDSVFSGLFMMLLLQDSEGDAKASSDTELEGEGEEKLEHIAASTDETQEMSND